MKKSTRSEIERIFSNRRNETHPFRRKSAGMEYFSRILPLVGELSKAELNTFLVPLVNDLHKEMNCCNVCKAKLFAFAEVYCSQKSSRMALRFWLRYQDSVASIRNPENRERDYKAEVYDAIERYLEDGERG